MQSSFRPLEEAHVFRADVDDTAVYVVREQWRRSAADGWNGNSPLSLRTSIKPILQ